ncbi:MAG: Rne/Rng family ribonuclease [Paludibacteraceae bacterium]|nr:Rne/Rng family ribonuclease [Paludibacteraceae bacterium]
MKSELIVDVQPQEIAIALTEDDRLQEFNREKRDEDNFSVGNIYYGRVKKVMPALNAVFVDVGYEREAFLHYLDLGLGFRTLREFTTKAISDRRKVPAFSSIKRQDEVGKEGQIADFLKVGDLLLVQVIKEPINTKGPRLTAELSIAGRNLVLIPFADKVMVSSKIKRESERSRLKQLVQSIKPHGCGVIVRTVAEDKRVMELDSELKLLSSRWEEVIRNLQVPKQKTTSDDSKKDPEVRLVGEELDRTIGILRDMFTTDFSGIHVNDEEMYEQIRQYVSMIAPGSVKVVKRYKNAQPIFDKFDITRQMKTGLGRTVGFKNGGYLVIDRTEALFSIDVNSGSKKLYEDQEENAFQYNMLAADEIVHQLRLRDIGGIIIIDFIDMDDKEHQDKLYEHMVSLMARDRAKHNVLPLSKFGLMQITRQRVRPAVEVNVTELCPTCMGKGKIQPSILFTDQVEEQIAQQVKEHGKGLTLYLHPFVYAYANKGWLGSLKNKWKRRYGVRVLEDQSLGLLQTRFSEKS